MRTRQRVGDPRRSVEKPVNRALTRRWHDVGLQRQLSRAKSNVKLLFDVVIGKLRCWDYEAR